MSSSRERERARDLALAANHPPSPASRKYKLPNQQNGQIYLTSHRICYVDKAEPRKHSAALDLKDVDRFEFYVCASHECPYLMPAWGYASSYPNTRLTGRLSQIVGQDHPDPQAGEAPLAAAPLAWPRRAIPTE